MYLITGWVRRQCNRLPNGFFVEVGRHQSKQTRNESYALCCDGTCILSLYATVVLFTYPKKIFSQFFNYRIHFLCVWILSQQSQKADLTLLTFPEELKHIEAASR